MSTPPAPPPAAPVAAPPIPLPEFVALIAALMALTALGIDSMLPALPTIGAALGAPGANERQYVIGAFLIAFGAGQLLHGPLADRFGRRRSLLAALAVYAVANALCAMAGSFALLLAARIIAGLAIAAARVTTVAIVRDCFEGRAMARVMSMTFIVFMIVPVLAPGFGTIVLLFGGWRDIFWAVGGATLLVLAWFALRMPETLHAEDRHPFSLARLASGWKLTLSDRWSLGYTLAATALMGALYGYINSIQQVMADVFGRPRLLLLIFATTAGTMAVANLANARLVMRVGTRRLGHAAVVTLILVAGLHLLLALSGHETLVGFAVLQAVAMGCFGLSSSNFSAMAMEKMGHIAGTASSVQGFTSVTVGAAIGAMIGQHFDGTTVPLNAGFLFAGVAALAIVLVTERGRLFAAR
ncbi:multidrug effflux MFS transporter [Sphingomonas sp. BK345]|uniref:multidrug effflux MFS transporter n=1 Tax=Sphingomonas sp. BK345 TaxID=2586980 RepID=UPI00161A5FA7|nr:multidrug effflux MFS transporter [Sphingomonas sp. BK345]MBB3475672.1 DHA1 family bicyclomycin/chloramphenicol resistance-like MFS transporter [Sphingomonas sp. BK345]